MEDNENDEQPTRIKDRQDRSPSPAIKSTAVVKYTAFQSPVGYARLQCNTDLNLPPSNWGAAIDSYGLKQILSSATGLSSFRMAHMFPDCVGDVDVISGAECIKKLLKLPYQPNGIVSMIVHRVENTLLLDDFGIYDCLAKSEWGWLKDFFYENILKTMSEQERMSLTLAPAPSSALQLTHKFLSHSVAAPAPAPSRPQPDHPMCLAEPFLPEPETRPEEPPKEHLYNRNVLWTFEDIHMLIGSDLPIFGDNDRPCVSLRLRDVREPITVLTGIDYWLDNLMCNVPEVLMCYHLDGIVQKYEPMKTEDLPNMENSKFSPKVIRNVAQNILSFLKSNATKAGHTYWLFKGPHDDVVKLYDLTSLCPDNMDNPFTTPVAMLLYRVARNMRLTNRTKHVKHLLEHVLELLRASQFPQIVASSHYMLADLYVPATTNPAAPDFKDESSESDEEDVDYARCDGDEASDTPASEKDNNDQEASSSKDVYPENKGDSKKEEESKMKQESKLDSDKDDNELAVQIRGLALNNIGDRVKESGTGDIRSGRGPPAGLGVAVAARCGRALRHALSGLAALTHLATGKGKEEERERLRQQIISEEQHPKMANPYEPITMNYEPIAKKEDAKEHTSRSRKRRGRKNSEKSTNYIIETAPNVDKNAILFRKENKSYPTWHEPNRDDNFAWKLHLKTLLYEKICLAYATLAEFSYANEQYGFSLKYIDMANKCQKLLSNMIIKSRVVDASCLIGRVGDNYFQLSKHWSRLEQYRKQFETDHDIDAQLRMEIEKDMVEETEGECGTEFDLAVSLPSSEVEAMLLSLAQYRSAAQLGAPGRGGRLAELRRRQASVTNELAVRYMHDAQQIYLKYVDEDDPSSPNAKLLLKEFSSVANRSLECLNEATAIFEEVKDVANLALLLCNKGRYMRFKAHCTPGDFTAEKRSLYRSAEELYQSALKLLGSRARAASAAAVWDLVSWELSAHLYTKAVLMQDCPDVFVNEASEVAEAFKMALRHCPLGAGPRQYLYQFRAAMIYHRLGSLYHALYRSTTSDGPRRRTLLSAARDHYAQASNTFAALEDPGMFLTAQMEHVAVLETQAAVTPNVKLKSLQTAIQLLRQCHSIMKVVKERDAEDQKDTPKPEDSDEKSMKSELSLISLFENRLNFILKSVIQYCRSKSNKDYEKITEQYKKLYSASLRIKRSDDVRAYASSICDVLEAMDDITKEYE